MKGRILIALLAIWAGAELPTVMSVQVRTTKVRATPSQLASVIATVKYGDTLAAGPLQRGWYPVTTPDGKPGYLHVSALSTQRISMQAGTADVATSVSQDEVALATKEVMGLFGEPLFDRETTDVLDFTWVDRMATFGVTEDQIVKFRVEGGLPGEAQ